MRPFLSMVSVGLACAAALSSISAQAQMIDARNPKTLFALAKAEGYAPEMINKKNETPSFRMNVNGTKSLILFMDCDDQQSNCKTIQFYAGYSVESVFNTDRINEWNRDKRFARAYVDNSGDPVIEMDLDLDFGGLPRANVVEAFSVWSSLLGSFSSFVNGDDAAAEADAT
jgi:hypothetical protein